MKMKGKRFEFIFESQFLVVTYKSLILALMAAM